MIESEADQVPDDVMYEGIVQAHEMVQPMLDLIDRMVAEIGKPKFSYEHAAFDDELFEKLVENEFAGMEYCMDTDDKNVREARVNEWVTAMQEKYEADHPEIMQYMDEILYKLQKKVVKKWLLAGKRVDGRAMNEIRPLGRGGRRAAPLSTAPALFTRGQTQVLSIATLNTLSAAQKLDTIWDEDREALSCTTTTCPRYSTGEAQAPPRSTGRREYGHGALAEKALQSGHPVRGGLPLRHPRGERSALLQRLHLAGLHLRHARSRSWTPACLIKAPVAGISCGLIQDGDNFTTFIDIQGVEDFHGEMDFKVAGTKEGITAIQMDLKNDGLTHEIIKEAFAITQRGPLPDPRRGHAQGHPRAAPRACQDRAQDDPDEHQPGQDPRGHRLRRQGHPEDHRRHRHQDRHRATTATSTLPARDIEACRAARKTIENIVFEPEVGALYYGKVVRHPAPTSARSSSWPPARTALCTSRILSSSAPRRSRTCSTSAI